MSSKLVTFKLFVHCVDKPTDDGLSIAVSCLVPYELILNHTDQDFEQIVPYMTNALAEYTKVRWVHRVFDYEESEDGKRILSLLIAREDESHEAYYTCSITYDDSKSTHFYRLYGYRLEGWGSMEDAMYESFEEDDLLIRDSRADDDFDHQADAQMHEPYTDDEIYDIIENPTDDPA